MKGILAGFAILAEVWLPEITGFLPVASPSVATIAVTAGHRPSSNLGGRAICISRQCRHHGKTGAKELPRKGPAGAVCGAVAAVSRETRADISRLVFQP